ncbi:clostripain-related cysteine peptidase [Coprobacter tertius]|uniref:Clostripain-related cysteine peptidase n=1 Tax=Coprobacter tertius TaxID=2944915 RepID=A0ABT1MI24_9BACT|nr:clostripain-related cysteine peptidase [Coprobacter tertius]MCP9611694.1 clostripain-related cysteine peptidase [Coprobacter tertius]
MAKIIKYRLGIFIIILLSLLISCNKEDNGVIPLLPKEQPTGEKQRTVLVYMLANNNLYPYGEDNIELMLNAVKNDALQGGNLLVYIDGIHAFPQLIQIKKDNHDHVKKLIIKEYSDRNSASKNSIKEVIDDAYYRFPAKEYGIIFWGHASGWVNESSDPLSFKTFLYHPNTPITRAYGTDGNAWINIDDLAEAIPDNKLQFILFDACYMANAETIYQLRNKAKYIIGSPTEVWASGHPYNTLIPRLFEENIDYEGICEDLYNYYLSYTYPYSTVSAIKCDELDSLARISRRIMLKFNENRAMLQRSEIQQFGRLQYKNNSFFDLDDYIAHIAPVTTPEYKEFSDQLSRTVIAKRYTSKFGDPFYGYVNIEHCCGISAYIPLTDEKNDFYFNLDWGKFIYNISSKP